MNTLETLGRYRDWGIAALRIMVGIVFAMHGGQKLFVQGPGAIGTAFGQMGIPLASTMGVVVTLVEFFGGLALIFGFLTRWAAILLAINMVGAVAFVHLPNGFFLPRGYEFALTLLVANLALVTTGAGALAVDNLWARRQVAEPKTFRSGA